VVVAYGGRINFQLVLSEFRDQWWVTSTAQPHSFNCAINKCASQSGSPIWRLPLSVA